MKIHFLPLLIFIFLLASCSNSTEKSPSINAIKLSFEVPEKTVAKSTLQHNRQTSMWTLNEHPYSGFVESYYPDGSLMEKFGVLNGMKQNTFSQWYPDGHLKSVRNYHLGKLDGEKKMWSSDSAHILIAQFNFKEGRAHGVQKKWYPTGELYKKLNMVNGKEEGIQQAYRKNGVLYANYEARNGRIFGLKKAALCYGLENENLKYEK